MLSPLAFVLVLSFGINRLSLFALGAVLGSLVGVMGLSMASIFRCSGGTSRVFFSPRDLRAVSLSATPPRPTCRVSARSCSWA
jgi:hypothetical protein